MDSTTTLKLSVLLFAKDVVEKELVHISRYVGLCRTGYRIFGAKIVRLADLQRKVSKTLVDLPREKVEARKGKIFGRAAQLATGQLGMFGDVAMVTNPNYVLSQARNAIDSLSLGQSFEGNWIYAVQVVLFAERHDSSSGSSRASYLADSDPERQLCQAQEQILPFVRGAQKCNFGYPTDFILVLVQRTNVPTGILFNLGRAYSITLLVNLLMRESLTTPGNTTGPKSMANTPSMLMNAISVQHETIIQVERVPHRGVELGDDEKAVPIKGPGFTGGKDISSDPNAYQLPDFQGSITRFGAVTSVWRNLAAFTKAKALIKYSIRAKDSWQKLLAIKTALTFWKATEKLGLTSSQIKTPFCASIEMSLRFLNVSLTMEWEWCYPQLSSGEEASMKVVPSQVGTKAKISHTNCEDKSLPRRFESLRLPFERLTRNCESAERRSSSTQIKLNKILIPPSFPQPYRFVKWGVRLSRGQLNVMDVTLSKIHRKGSDVPPSIPTGGTLKEELC
ncbi:hypothetical protein BT69DRAFT_1325306 [Atractiella rhizophila]|nr:hypothetical protein BT69DRAFT_1325306 [Atractiella rhizophila]